MSSVMRTKCNLPLFARNVSRPTSNDRGFQHEREQPFDGMRPGWNVFSLSALKRGRGLG